MAEGGFKYPLFGCFGDCSVCIFVYCCTCVAVGELAETLGNDKWLYCFLHILIIQFFGGLGAIAYQTYFIQKIREQRGIEGSCLKDCLLNWCCPVCYITQVLREVRDDPEAQVMIRE